MPEYVYQSDDGEQISRFLRMAEDHPWQIEERGKTFTRVFNNQRLNDKTAPCDQYPYTSMKLAGTPAADDCPKVRVAMGKKTRGVVEVPIVKSKRHEANLAAKHGFHRI